MTDDQVHLLPDKLRVDCKWATFSLVQAELNLLSYAAKRRSYDFFWFCSGQDYPIKSTSYILNYFENHKHNNFLDLGVSQNWGGTQQPGQAERDLLSILPIWKIKRKAFVKEIIC